MKCIGVDIFVVSKDRPSKLPREFDSFVLESVSNRGMAYDVDQEPDFMLVDWHLCRYVSAEEVSEEKILKLVGEVGRFYSWEKIQKLFVSESLEPLYSKVHQS
ncbi:MAG: hypothetical protein ACO3LE_06670 [Bdellovibrionota bacterium]